MRMESLGHEMDKAKREIGLDGGEIAHRRGQYHCINTGLSLGSGSKVFVVSTLLQLHLTHFRRDLGSSRSGAPLRSRRWPL